MELKKELIEDMYYNQKMSIRKIGKELGCSDHTIANFMKENRIIVKSKNLEELSIEKKEEIETLYTMGFNPREISEKIDVTESKIKSYLISSDLWISKDKFTKKELQELYLAEKLTIREIANLKQCSIKKVQLALERFHISTKRRKYAFNKHELELLYIKYHISINKIAKIKQSSNWYVKKALERFELLEKTN